jgi:hypothetical protein
LLQVLVHNICSRRGIKVMKNEITKLKKSPFLIEQETAD